MWETPTALFDDGMEWESRNVLEVHKGKKVVFSPEGIPKECSHNNSLTLAYWDYFVDLFSIRSLI